MKGWAVSTTFPPKSKEPKTLCLMFKLIFNGLLIISFVIFQGGVFLSHLVLLVFFNEALADAEGRPDSKPDASADSTFNLV